MSRLGKVLVAFGVLLLCYPLLLLILGYVLAGQVEERVRTRLEFALRVDDVKIENVSVSLLRGRIEVEGVHAEREGVGTASLDIASLEIEVAPMGWVIVDDSVDKVQVEGAHLELSALGAATLRQSDGPSLEMGELLIRDSSITLVASSLFPSVGQAKLTVNEAHARDLELDNAMSWLYKTDVLDANLLAPGDSKFGINYRDETMSVSGSIFGSEPVSIPFVWPIPDPRELEISQILELTTSLSKKIASEYAKRKAKGVWKDVTELLDDE